MSLKRIVNSNGKGKTKKQKINIEDSKNDYKLSETKLIMNSKSFKSSADAKCDVSADAKIFQSGADVLTDVLTDVSADSKIFQSNTSVRISSCKIIDDIKENDSSSGDKINDLEINDKPIINIANLDDVNDMYWINQCQGPFNWVNLDPFNWVSPIYTQMSNSDLHSTHPNYPRYKTQVECELNTATLPDELQKIIAYYLKNDDIYRICATPTYKYFIVKYPIIVQAFNQNFVLVNAFHNNEKIVTKLLDNFQGTKCGIDNLLEEIFEHDTLTSHKFDFAYKVIKKLFKDKNLIGLIDDDWISKICHKIIGILCVHNLVPFYNKYLTILILFIKHKFVYCNNTLMFIDALYVVNFKNSKEKEKLEKLKTLLGSKMEMALDNSTERQYTFYRHIDCYPSLQIYWDNLEKKDKVTRGIKKLMFFDLKLVIDEKFIESTLEDEKFFDEDEFFIMTLVSDIMHHQWKGDMLKFAVKLLKKVDKLDIIREDMHEVITRTFYRTGFNAPKKCSDDEFVIVGKIIDGGINFNIEFPRLMEYLYSQVCF